MDFELSENSAPSDSVPRLAQVDEHLDEDLHADALAHEAHLSRSHFFKLFQRISRPSSMPTY